MDASLNETELRSILADLLEGAAEKLRAHRGGSSRNCPVVEGDSVVLRPGSTEKLTLTVCEAAERLGISRSAAYEAVRTGTIPSLRFGKRLLIPSHRLAQRIDQLADTTRSDV